MGSFRQKIVGDRELGLQRMHAHSLSCVANKLIGLFEFGQHQNSNSGEPLKRPPATDISDSATLTEAMNGGEIGHAPIYSLGIGGAQLMR